MSFSYFSNMFVSMLPGLKYTLGLFVWTILTAIPLGMVLTFGKISRFKVLNKIIGFYVWVMRGTPLLLQLFFFYFGLPFIPVIGKYLTMEAFQAACLTFSLNYSAYFCEIFRGGILSVEKGQYEAAKVLGFSKWQTTLKIVIPQMLRVSLPPLCNESITLVKDTALVTAIAVTELLFFAKTYVSRNVDPMAYVVAAVFYLTMTFIITKVFQRLEKKFNY
ncbi:MAG: amino acid ABC transporter permease [Bacillota bacterium]|nr:amino acid ABC transporter permease [Bacillota bacterium]